MRVEGAQDVVRVLHTAVIADILDSLDLRDQALDGRVAPLAPGTKLYGRALTVRAKGTSVIGEDPYRRELEAVDALSPGDVVVASVDPEVVCGFWGELLSTAAIRSGARGAVIDGMTRDSDAIRTLDFPVFARGCSPLDSKGRSEVVAVAEPIECAGVPVATGDMIFGDGDGVTVIPSSHAERVIQLALAKVTRESEMRTALESGMNVLQAYDTYGVL